MNKTIVIGGGPAGMMAAYSAAKYGAQVVLLEKNEKLGKKLYITGKGRCNITNDSDVENHLAQITCNRKFMYSSLYTFDSYAAIQFFNEHGLLTKVERGNRVFPVSDKSNDVIKTFHKALLEVGVDIRLRVNVLGINHEGGRIKELETNQGVITADNIVIATGGLSYPITGSDGSGFKMARQIGHEITSTFPGLVPFETRDEDVKSLQGLALRNVELTLYDNKDIVLYKELGEMLFTHFGLSGPLVLSASSHIPRSSSAKKCRVTIDMKPAMDEQKLDKRILRDFDKYQKKTIKNGLVDLMPASMIPIMIQRLGVDEHTHIYDITKEVRQELVKLLKAFPIGIKDLRSYKEAIITRGGINLDNIDPHTMESKLIKGLYFAGEILDLDAYTGGYNLQIAYSTGYLAGMSIGTKE